MVGRRRILPGEDGVADLLAAAFETGGVLFGPVRKPRQRDGPPGIEPPTVRRACSPLGIVRKPAACAGIAAPGIAMWRCQRLGNVGAGAKTGIDQPLFPEPIQRSCVVSRPLGLDDRLGVKVEAQPGQILVNALDKLQTAAAGVEILDPQQEFPAAGARMDMPQCRRKGMSQVQPAGRRGGETCDLQDSLHSKGDEGGT